ncbi:hypothetical protein [Acetobacter orientalis]|uniref:hypothetical protein n=1 Tax=Acetobacter orientalis TaxID=146474 RepID=UPI0039EAFEDB
MSRKTLHALRLYASPVFTRENPTFFTGLLFVGVCILATYFEHTPATQHAGPFKLPPQLGVWWWLSLQALLTSIACHYWRQVRSPLACMTAGMIDAEYHAVHYVLASALLLLALPLVLIGAPPLNVLAQESLCAALSVNGDMVGPKQLRKPMRLLRVLLMFFIFAAFMFPGAQEAVLSAPWYVALGLIGISLIFTLIELHHRPVPPATVQSAYTPVKQDSPKILPYAKRTNTSTSTSTSTSTRISALLLWQFAWLRQPAMPNTMATPGPVGFALSAAVLLIGFIILTVFMGIFTQGALPTWPHLKMGLRSAPVMLCMVFSSGLSTWLLARADWPFMLNLAGYGTRYNFAVALYATHAKRTVQLACMVTLTCAPLGIFLSNLPWHRLPLTALCLFSTVIGVSYLPSLGILLFKKSQTIFITVLNLLGSFVGLQSAFLIMLSKTQPPLWFYALTLSAIPFAACMAWAAPRALARADWPIQPPATP